MTIAKLLARREALIQRCRAVDRDAATLRELGASLTEAVIAGFDSHAELRAVEHAIAKMKERK